MARTDPRTLHFEGVRELLGPKCREGDTNFLDAHNAVLHEYSEAAPVSSYAFDEGRSEQAIALTLGGRVNRSKDQADILYMTNVEGAASIIAELMGAAHVIGGKGFVAELLDRAQEKIGEK